MLAQSKNITTFALRQLLLGSVNLRFYQNLHKRLGVVNPNSKGTAISDCRKSGKATPFFFLTIFKFFTNATISKKFWSRRSTVSCAKRYPTKRGILFIRIFRKLQMGAPILQERQVPLPVQNPTRALPLCNSPHTPRAGKPNLAKTQPVPALQLSLILVLFIHSSKLNYASL